jgi:nitrate/TMAO reductase-like tetraheme cytochrome c subunit
MLKWMSSFLPHLGANCVTLLGSVLTTVSAVCMAALGALLVVADGTDVYKAALALLVFPILFVGGLVIIALGFLWQRVRMKRKGGAPDPLSQALATAFQDAAIRRQAVFVGIATVINVVIVLLTGAAAVNYMDTPVFCGTLCHSVMQPEYDTYRESPHSRVKCVTCHIGPGASFAVKSKVDGLRQVWGVATGNFHRPIPSPVEELRPARDTCEQCHWPSKFHGNRVAFRMHYQDDEANTPTVNTLLLKVGGRDSMTGEFRGIHWHVDQGTEIRYESLDARREKIGVVQVYKKGALTAEYKLKDAAANGTALRTMDCIDCHNRPTHIYDATPALAVDRAFNEDALDRAVPFLHEVAAKALTLAAAEKVDRDTVQAWLKDRMKALYQELHSDKIPSDEALEKAAAGVAPLYLRNVYPHMSLTFGTHFNHLGHQGEDKDRRGCFRCHDDEHATAEGKTISQDCELCHGILTMDEDPSAVPDPLKALMSAGSSK